MSKDKVKKFGDLAYEYIRKKLIKPGKGGITSLPTDKEITDEMLVMFENLREAGYNVTNIGKEVKNADDLGFLINRIDQAEINQAKEFSDAAEALETIQYKLNNNIPLNPEDQKKLLGKNFKTASEAFQGFTPKVIEGGRKEGIKSLDLAKELEELTNKNLKERGLGDIKLGDKLPPPKKKKPAVDPELQKSEDRKKIIEDFKKRNDMEDRAIEDFVDDAGGVDPDDPRAIDDFIPAPEPDDFDAAQGGIARVGMNVGGRLFKFLSENNPIQAYKKYLQSVKRRSIEGDFKSLGPELGAISAGGILVNRKMKSIFEDMKEQDKEKFLREYTEEINNNPKYKDRPELRDKLIENYTESLFGKKKAMGGRIGFKEGGGMTRRTFLKLLGGLASIPIVGKFLKPAAKASKAVEVASKTSGVPAYFPKLVEKIQLLGDDITKTAATKERQVVKKYKNYELTEDLSTGELTVKRDNYVSEEYLQFEPGGSYYDETRKKEIKYPTEYEEVTVKPDYEGKMKDVDYGLDNIDEIMREVDMIETDYKIAPGGKIRDKKSGGGLAYMMGE